jgi:hypothetical protein
LEALEDRAAPAAVASHFPGHAFSAGLLGAAAVQAPLLPAILAATVHAAHRGAPRTAEQGPAPPAPSASGPALDPFIPAETAPDPDGDPPTPFGGPLDPIGTPVGL